MNTFSSVEGNRFEAKIKILHNNNQKLLIEKINNYLKRFYNNEQYILEKETPNILILNFKNNTEIANCVLRFLKIKRLEELELSNIYCSIHIKIVNAFSNKKYWNKPLLHPSSTLDKKNYIFSKNGRYKNNSRKKNNLTSNNTKYNAIESIYFFNVNKKETLSNNNNYSDTENILNKSIPKKSNNNWLIQIKSNLNQNNDNCNNNKEIDDNNKYEG